MACIVTVCTEMENSVINTSTLYTTLPHNLIKEKLIDLTFQWESTLYLACNDRNAFFTSEEQTKYTLWACQKVCETLTVLLNNIYISFGTTRQKKKKKKKNAYSTVCKIMTN